MLPLHNPPGPWPNTAILKGVHVLVVEDAWHVAEAMKSALHQMEVNVIGPAASVAAAKKLVADQAPDLALVDVNLKRETASELVDELHARGIPIIIISGYAVPPVAMEKSATFLQKPFSSRELMESMCTVLQQRR